MNQKLKDLFLGKDYDARQTAFAARLRAEVEAEQQAMFKGRAVVLRTGDKVQIKGTDTVGVVRRVTKETDGSLYARVSVPTGAPVEAPVVTRAPVVVKAAAVGVAYKADPADGKIGVLLEKFNNGLGNVTGALERGVVAVCDRIAEGSANLSASIQSVTDKLPELVADSGHRDHFINVDRLVKVEKAPAAPQPRV